MARTGIGQDGYTLIQKETTYGTAATNAMTALLAESGSKFDGAPERIENAPLIGMRVKQQYDQGRNKVNFDLSHKLYPSLAGLFMNLFLGTSTNTGPADSAYTHTWFIPTSGENTGKSATIRNARGADLASQYLGCVISKFSMKLDNNGQAMCTFSGVGQSYSDGITRVNVSTLTFPSIRPISFAQTVLKVTPAGSSQVTLPCNSLELDIDLSYDLEDFKIGSANIQQPVFKSIPKVNLKVNVDADNQYRIDAHNLKLYSALIQMTSAQYVGAGTTPYKIEFELPSGQLSPDVNIPVTAGRASMDLDWDFSLGGNTTGSPSGIVMGEVRVVDITPTYA